MNNDRIVQAKNLSLLQKQPRQTRRSIRLRGYDYSQAGAYFLTICTHDRKCLFGEIADGEMILNDAGRMVQTVWDELMMRFLHLELDEFVVMPNHVHGGMYLRHFRVTS